MPASPKHRKNKSSLLPSLTTTDTVNDYDTSFKEPSKIEKLAELSNKFKN